MRRTCARFAASFVFLILASVAQAQTYTATLSGANENPPVSTSGTGSVTVLIDQTSNMMRVVANFTGLNSNTTAAHIHCCAAAPTSNAGVATTLPSFVGFPLGVTSGSMNELYDLRAATTWNPAYIAANGGSPASAQAALMAGLGAGQAYFNIHTVTSPGGELRGNLALASVPTLPQWMVGLGALLTTAAAYFVLRRRPLTA